MTIDEFLLARIAEDEERAKAALDGDLDRLPSVTTRSGDLIYLGVTDPARVLAECEAKRRIVEIHHPLPDDPEPFCWNCDEESWPCKTMAALALPYADHPDYRPEWRP